MPKVYRSLLYTGNLNLQSGHTFSNSIRILKEDIGLKARHLKVYVREIYRGYSKIFLFLGSVPYFNLKD